MPDKLIKGYKELENEFLKRVEKDRELLSFDNIVYLPLFLKPTRRVKYVFVGMEPSLTKKWADPPNRSMAEAQIKGGYLNLVPDRFEDAMIHYCAQNYLHIDYHGYYITDMSKGAMPPQKANEERITTWLNWLPLLKEELELVAEEDAQIFAIGKSVEGFLLGRASKKKILQDNNMEKYKDIVGWIDKHYGKVKYFPHYGPANHGYWSKYITKHGLEGTYAKFKLEDNDLIDFAEKLLSDTHTEEYLKETCMSRLRKHDFNDTLIKMAFVYKDILTPYRTG